MVLVVHQVLHGLKSTTSLVDCVARHLKVPTDAVKSVNVVRRSIDARKRGRQPVINFVYKVHVELSSKAYEREILANNGQSFAEPLLEHTAFQPSKIRFPLTSTSSPPSSPNTSSIHSPWSTPSSASPGSIATNADASKATDPSPSPSPTSVPCPSILSSSSACVRPIIVGSGPAGLFAAYTLASSGLKPILIEQGPKVERRAKDLMRFWKENELTECSNGVFGEGGAGTFSDGKLTTRTSSPYHRFVHEVLIKYGAKPNILYESRAHVGTDQLRKIITRFSREAVSNNNGTILYNTRVEGLVLSPDGAAVVGVKVKRMPLTSVQEEQEWQKAYDGLVKDGVIDNDGVISCSNSNSSISSISNNSNNSNIGNISNDINDSISNSNLGNNSDTSPSSELQQEQQQFSLKSSAVFLGTGHSSRSMFSSLHKAGVALSQKDFAFGLRLQISQKYINKVQFGDFAGDKALGPAEFSLKYFDGETKRSVYTFCMCPGGVIVNASHGNDEVAVNGMSYSTRASRYANAAFVVTVSGSDFDNYGNLEPGHPLAGMRFQEHWERKCFDLAGGDYSAPAQRVVDYINKVDKSDDPNSPLPDHIFMGKLAHVNLHQVLPDVVNKALVNALQHFSKNIPGLVEKDALLVGIESRTSSPVRVNRDPHTLESTSTKGLYPMGEGAGYAGGIMTACVDGVRSAEAFIAMCNGDLHSVPLYEVVNNEIVASTRPISAKNGEDSSVTDDGVSGKMLKKKRKEESAFKYPSW